MNRSRPRSKIGRWALCLTAGSAVFATAVLGGATSVAGGAEEPAHPASYEAVASAEGVRFSFGAPGFVAVDTFIDGGGPVAQSVIDGLGNSRAFASLPYPGDLAISGPGLLAGLTGLPSPPSYPFFVSSSHPTTPEAKLTQPGYELVATSNESSSQGTAKTGGAQNGSAVGSTMANTITSRDTASGVVTAEATGTSDIVNIGGVLRIGQVAALAKVTRGPGTEPTREASFVINGMTIAGQTVGFSEKGFTFGGTTMPIPKENPLLAALAQAKITVQYLARIDNPDGVVSPGLIIRQEQATPGGPTMVIRYVFGQMAASATVSGGPTSVGDSLPALDSGPSDTQVISPPAEVAAPPTTTEPPPLPAATDINSGTGFDSSAYGTGGTRAVSDSGSVAATEPAPAEAAPAAGVPQNTVVQEAAPISRTPMTLVDTASVYLILVAAAVVALIGGTVLRLVGVKLKWTS